MSMTKQDFEEIAEVLNSLVNGTLANTSCGGLTQSLYANGWHCETLIDCFCDLLASENPNFNKKKFIEACGFEPWTELVMGVPNYLEGD